MLTAKSSIFRTYWLYGCVAGLFLAVFSAYPQIKLQLNQGDAWQGHYAYNDIDEVAYAAYLKALIDGRPRKNDPYTGRDDSLEDPQPESLFSIQFAAPYSVAIPARIFGISAPTAMTLAGVIAAFLTAFICFILIREVSGHTVLGFAGALFVLCGGALFAGEGAIGEITGTGFPYPYFPFLRRYVPAVPFPVLFFLFYSAWKLLKSEDGKRVAVWTLSVTAAFSYLVFSYFYIWTTAAAWLFSLGLAVLVFRPDGWKSMTKRLSIVAGACVIPLGIYGYLLSQRGESMDNVQLLVHSRSLDLDRMPMIISIVLAVCLVAAVAARVLDKSSLRFAFAAATIFVSVILFNQQVVTGMSLQPIHYQVFVGNYVAGLAIVLVAGLMLAKLKSAESNAVTATLTVVAVLSVVWGFVECHYTVRVLDEANVIRDKGMAVGRLLTESAAQSPDPFHDTVFAVSNIYGDDAPTIAPQNVLWARHQHVFAGLSWNESKERFYRFLYFRDLDPEWLDNQLKRGNFVATIALFGWGRHTSRLSAESTPLTYGEIEDEVKKFRTFVEGFGATQAYEPNLKYLVVPAGQKNEFENLSRWYTKRLIKEANGNLVFDLSAVSTKK
ncbi:MAG: hypothetical protein HKN33_14250 [Pyrinomonadaceae bacterium]|nr:hypothetical protein [Pyrinomonadaceae bacterium]